MPHLVVVSSISQISQQHWDMCFPNELENWCYYLATEQADLEGFEYRYLMLFQDDQPLAALPSFRTTYRLDTTVQGGLKTVLSALTNRMPRLLTLRMACLGSPVAEICHLGFAPQVDEKDKKNLLARLLNEFEALSIKDGCGLLGVKDTPQAHHDLWDHALAATYQHMPGLPTADLPITFTDTADYLSGLSRATRRDLKRKMRAATGLTIEYRRNIDDVIDAVFDLYLQTATKSDTQFETLTPTWFTGILKHMPTALCVLFWHNQTLVGFNLLLSGHGRLIDKFIGMDGHLGRQHNLYFVSWLRNLEFCLNKGIGCYQSGQAGYGPKKSLGCRFHPNWIWFRHANPVINRILALCSRFLHLDRYDPNLAALLEQTRHD